MSEKIKVNNQLFLQLKELCDKQKEADDGLETIVIAHFYGDLKGYKEISKLSTWELTRILVKGFYTEYVEVCEYEND
jgi:hypothetical protein